MTPEQLVELKSNIAANVTTIDWLGAPTAINALPNADDANFAIAAWYNLTASPSFFVWRSLISVNEVMQNGFDWTRVDNLTIGKARIWDWMQQTGELRPSRVNVRAGVLAAFNVAADLNTRQAIFSHFQRPATNVEKVFAVGSGTSSTDQGIGPATMGFDGMVSYADVASARTTV